ncbi:MAG TPA: 23S rRNA (guanosine(2251)-2'-O)-methyltransferase RlmB [Campylobacterales bacterium]|nr:23S rRNA (guanosine(2251)-2'-O)-methyltransferase RlmB [Campylobacterales bacterium]
MYIYGKQVFWHLVDNHPSLIEEIYLAKEVDKKEFGKIGKLEKKIIKLDEKKAQAMARGGAHQGFLAKVTDLKLSSLDELKKQNFLVALVGVTDMGNIGSIIRSARALGVDGIILSQIKDVNFEGAVKSSSGAIFDMPLAHAINPLDMLHELSQVGFNIIAAGLNGEESQGVKRGEKTLLLLGSEGEGLPKKVLQKANSVVTIKMHNNFDSLNVATAAAILIDRITRE